MPLKSPRIRQKDLKSSGILAHKNNSPRAAYNKPLIAGQQLKKPPSFSQRVQKTTVVSSADKENKQNKQLQLARDKPNAILLTPSSSDNSLTTTFSRDGGAVSYTILPSNDETKDTPVASNAIKDVATPCLSVCFRSRKSLSQIDFKEALRTYNSQMVPRLSNSHAGNGNGGSSSSLTIMLLKEADLICQTREVFEVQTLHKIGRDRFMRPGNLRIFNTLLLYHSRRQRDEMRVLSEQVEVQKRGFVKTRNKLHLTNVMFAMNERSNEILNSQVLQAQKDSATQKALYDDLNSLFQLTKKEKEQLTNNLASMKEENENLQKILDSTRKDLFYANTEQRTQSEKMARLQRDYQQVLHKNEDLLEQVEMDELQLRVKADTVGLLSESNETLSERILMLEKDVERGKLVLQQQKKKYLEKMAVIEADLKQRTQALKTVQSCFAATVGQRIRRYLNESQTDSASFSINTFYHRDNILPQNYLNPW
ncbi:girdin isoform X2 [Drosophila tropicalis]|uniref:girdin isoform X2 n=1 Tax=Drosophila tropicalis TaxID=46794 RepID=UPI0035ABE3BE